MADDKVMKEFFSNKVIYIFSPQPWNYLQLSKHHYARALAGKNRVYFIEPPADGSRFAYAQEGTQDGTQRISYTIPSPWFLRVKFPVVYKIILLHYLKKIVGQYLPPCDVAIDFGCYQQFNSLHFVKASKKVFFPVDDFGTLQPDSRGADLVLTVSKNIQEKFPLGKCHFINHGLSMDFSDRAIRQNKSWRRDSLIRVGCSGNLFIRYLDTPVIMQLILQNPQVEFNFFGSHQANHSVEWQQQWSVFLNNTPNVKLHGVLSAPALSEAYEEMDLFLLCYKPDYINYHGENSHKVLEYISTGKVLVSTHLTIYENTKLFEMAPKDQNQQLIALFSSVIKHLAHFNSDERMELRKQFALDNTYDRQIERIGDWLTEQKSEAIN